MRNGKRLAVHRISQNCLRCFCQLQVDSFIVCAALLRFVEYPKYEITSVRQRARISESGTPVHEPTTDQPWMQ